MIDFLQVILEIGISTFIGLLIMAWLFGWEKS